LFHHRTKRMRVLQLQSICWHLKTLICIILYSSQIPYSALQDVKALLHLLSIILHNILLIVHILSLLLKILLLHILLLLNITLHNILLLQSLFLKIPLLLIKTILLLRNFLLLSIILLLLKILQRLQRRKVKMPRWTNPTFIFRPSWGIFLVIFKSINTRNRCRTWVFQV
jgi:hypothetical protein